MPTNPTTPSSNASIDRLTLGADFPRGTQASLHLSPCACFEGEAASFGPPPGSCCAFCPCFEPE